jgi:hypothetical protein
MVSGAPAIGSSEIAATGANLADWIAALAKVAQQRWDDGRKLLLVSQIPAVLSAEGTDVLAMRGGRPLLTALKAEAGDNLHFVQHPVHTAVWAVLPKKVASTVDMRTIFDKPDAAKSVDIIQVARKYKGWFWAAFVKALEPGKRRWLGAGHFRDENAPISQPPDGCIEVLESDVVNPGLGVPPDEAAVLESMSKWALRNSISLNPFKVVNTASDHASQKKHSISLAFDSLGTEDLSRIFVPLDIVFKLLRH